MITPDPQAFPPTSVPPTSATYSSSFPSTLYPSSYVSSSYELPSSTPYYTTNYQPYTATATTIPASIPTTPLPAIPYEGASYTSTLPATIPSYAPTSYETAPVTPGYSSYYVSSPPAFTTGLPLMPSAVRTIRPPPSAQPSIRPRAFPVRPGCTKALLIGVNYRNQGAGKELYGCINDIRCLAQFVEDQGWERDNIVMMDEEQAYDLQPTRANIIRMMQWLMDGARPGDALFFAFSGHGKQVVDTNGDEEDGLDEAMIALDGELIVDDDLFNLLVKRLPQGAVLTAITDCCHAGTILDLPFQMRSGYRAKGPAPGTPPLPSGLVICFSGCQDEQASGDVDANAGYAGGACTNALLCALSNLGQDCTFGQVLSEMTLDIRSRGMPQVPMISASHPLNPREYFSLTAQEDYMRPLPRLRSDDALNPYIPFIRLDQHALTAAPKGGAPRTRGWFDNVAGALSGGGGGGGGFGGQAQHMLGSVMGGGSAGSNSAAVDNLMGSLGVDKVVAGIKEALDVAISKAIQLVGVQDGFLRNPGIKIPVPPKLQMVANTMRGMGLGQQVDQFEVSLNRAAEQAAPQARNIFMQAIKSMSIDDVKGVWRGQDTTAATKYLQRNCSEPLRQAFAPIVRTTMNQSGVTQIYGSLVSQVSHLPMVGEVAKSFEVEGYTVGRSLDGLFKVMGEEETKIRQDPAHRVTDLLQSVFRDLPN